MTVLSRFSRTLSSSAMPRSFKYVIVGAGNAAGYAVAEFVARGAAAGDVALVGAEDVLPYERPALSKGVLTAGVRLPGFHTCVGGGGARQGRDFYDDAGVELFLGKKVTKMTGRTLVLDGGEEVTGTEAVVLCTGADAIRLDMLPGAGLDGVVYLRNNADALVLAERLAACKGKKVVVVGGGYIGCEVAAAAAEVGCVTTMIFPEESIMSRLFSAELGRHYEEAFKEMGVELLCNGRVCKAFVGDGTKVTAVKVCKDGDDTELPAELVVVGVGARPATAVFGDAVEKDKSGGVIVDGDFKTTAEGVWAVGDIAKFPLLKYGRDARVEHVGHARSSAKHAVRDIMGADQDKYDYLPFFYSRAGKTISWKFYGDNAGDCVVLGDRKTKLAAFWVKDGAVLGAFCDEPTDDESEALKTIATEQPATDAAVLKATGSAAAAFKLLAGK